MPGGTASCGAVRTGTERLAGPGSHEPPRRPATRRSERRPVALRGPIPIARRHVRRPVGVEVRPDLERRRQVRTVDRRGDGPRIARSCRPLEHRERRARPAETQVGGRRRPFRPFEPAVVVVRRLRLDRQPVCVGTDDDEHVVLADAIGPGHQPAEAHGSALVEWHRRVDGPGDLNRGRDPEVAVDRLPDQHASLGLEPERAAGQRQDEDPVIGRRGDRGGIEDRPILVPGDDRSGQRSCRAGGSGRRRGGRGRGRDRGTRRGHGARRRDRARTRLGRRRRHGGRSARSDQSCQEGGRDPARGRAAHPTSCR